ncbi:MAG: RiPP maturation radical SAM protein 1 [Candidatus Riflebacteria bacterium]|nr:RiPP maturation radical SAM protein 1 [Candidatus Riflebacteria bacterium]
MPNQKVPPIDLPTLVARSAFPFERLRGPFVATDASEDRSMVRTRLDAWAKVLLPDGRHEGLLRFLGCAGLDPSEARRAVAPVRYPEGASLPGWTVTLTEAVIEAHAQASEAEQGPLDPGHPVPFQEVLVPFVRVYRRRVARRVNRDRVAAPALSSLEHDVLSTLASVAARCLHLEFDVFRGREQAFCRAFPIAGSPAPDRFYREFVARMLGGALGPFFEEYPVLGRLLATLTDASVQAHLELLGRLQEDWDELQRTFGNDLDLGGVKNVVVCPTWPRDGGRRPVDIEFESGGHGWLETARPESCATARQVERYYRRAGVLLCVVYMLDGASCGCETVVACGEQPVLFDCETLLQPRPGPGGRGEEPQIDRACPLPWDHLEDSVLRTGLLPEWPCGGGATTDRSGFLGRPGEDPRWEEINTDGMTVSTAPKAPPCGPNRPALAGGNADLGAYTDALKAGFHDCYRFLAGRRDVLARPDGPLRPFGACQVRFVFRPLEDYRLIRSRMLRPDALHDGTAYGITVEALARAYLTSKGRPWAWPLLDCERDCLQRLEQPIFHVGGDDTHLSSGGSRLDLIPLETSPLEAIRRRVQGLSESALRDQSRILDAALVSLSPPAVLESAFVTRRGRPGAPSVSPRSGICLVNMPCAPLERPSIALGLLKAILARDGHEVSVFHANLWFAEFVGLVRWNTLSRTSQFWSSADWVFANVAFPGHAQRPGRYLDIVRAGTPGLGARQVEELQEMRDTSSAFVDWAASRILSCQPRIVGTTSTFRQHVPALALLKRIRELAPGVTTIMGGANCETTMGRTTHRSFPWVDFVVSGDGDGLISGLCRDILTHGRDMPVEAVPVGVWAPVHRTVGYPTSDGDDACPRATHIPPAGTPPPDYDDFFEELHSNVLGQLIQPGLLVETSRGCWWGQKQQCTFCGLTGCGMQYRAKGPDQAVSEIRHVWERYRGRGPLRAGGIATVDNVLAPEYFGSVLPRLADLDEKPALFYEVRATLDRSHLEQLHLAGVTWIQVGVESLHTEALALMHKGTAAWQAVRILKWCRQLGIRAGWNLLHGLPLEDQAWYAEMAEWLPLISHLQPGQLNRLVLARYSRYVDRADEFGLRLKPHPVLGHIYPLPEHVLAGLTTVFVSPPCGPDADSIAGTADDPPGVALVRRVMDSWSRSWEYAPPELVAHDDRTSMRVLDTRPCAGRHSGWPGRGTRRLASGA